MRLLVDKGGKPRGPYTLEELRALVLSGEFSALDWAWPEGATSWIALKDVPGFSPGPAAAAGSGQAPSLAAPIKPEEELWSGRPSQVLNLKLYLGWTIVLLGILAATLVHHDLWWLLAALAGLAILQIVLRNLRIRAIRYVVTTQRVRVISGLFHRNIQEIELFRVKDTMVHQWFFQRLFGLGTITILSGDAHLPRLVLHGVPGAVELRERLRDEVIALRQRYNVREFDMM
jgi:membrane protein YdbS with pleckstrin-like domain